MDKTMKDMHNDFWHVSQVAIIFQIEAAFLDTLPITFSDSDDDFSGFKKSEIVPLANLNGLKGFLKQHHITLTDFKVQDTLRRADDTPPDSKLIGKYLFRSLDQGIPVPTVIGFFKFVEGDVTQPAVGSVTPEKWSPAAGMSESGTGMSMPAAGMSMPGTGKVNGDNYTRDMHSESGTGMSMPGTGKVNDDNYTHDMHSKLRRVAQVVNLINGHLDKPWNQTKGKIPVVAASPVWLSGATPCIPRGCPAIPPIPVPADISCSTGLWPITLQNLSAEMEVATGEGVTVFILDTLPKPGEINRAAEAAEEHNLLLLDVANNVKHDYRILPASLDVPSPYQPVVGKDILGRDVGFRMPDHGLFIAGIVRDLAPNAQVECIRILNDWCVGDMPTFIKSLEDIHNRMLEGGDLYQKPVVINMSLNATPSPEEAQTYGLTVQVIRDSLMPPLLSLVALGAVFAASAGNEADIRMNPSGTRPGAVFPAALADEPTLLPEMIPVGALDSNGNPTSYSCYPGPHGIATYGGEVPKPAEKKSSNGMTLATDVDALIGIYSSMSYPALSVDDPHARYPVPNTEGWAYWVGTSFATPIIAAVAARVQELKLRGQIPLTTSVASYVTGSVSTPQPKAWTHLAPSASPSSTASGRMIKAVQ